MSNFIKILAIDTSTDACSVALYLNNRVESKSCIAPKKHTELILPMIRDLIQNAALVLQDLDALAFGCGPGSFTGIRIASGIIQGLGYGLNKPILPVSTLRAIAQGAYHKKGSKEVLAILDARMQEVYWGLYKVDDCGIMQSVSKESLQALGDIKLPSGSWETCTGYPQAEDIAWIAASDYKKNKNNAVSAFDALPIYLRDDIVKKNTK